MIEKKRFIKSGILLTAVGLSIRTVTMFFGAYVTRVVGAEVTGLYTLIMTVYSFAVTLATSGISLTVTRLVASRIGEGKPSEVGRVLRGSFIYSFLFGMLSFVGLFFGAGFLGNTILSDTRTVNALKVLAFSLIPAALSAALSGYFIGVKRVSFNATVSVFCQILRITLTVVLVNLFSKKGTVSAVNGLCIGITATEILGFLLILIEFLYDYGKHGVKSKNTSPEIKVVSKNALPLGFSAYVRSLLLNIEHIMIPRKLREKGETVEEAYSHYGTLHGMALPVVTYPMSPLSSFAGLLVPEFAEDMSAGRQKRMNRIASKAINSTLTYAIISAVFLYFFAEELGYAMYNSYDAGYYISALSFVVPIMYLDHVTDSMLKGIGEHVFSMWVNITDSLLSVILVWLLIPRMGIMGYALVIVLMEAYNFLLSFLRLKGKISFTITPLKSVIIPLLISLFALNITAGLFIFSGKGAPTLWVSLKIIFAGAMVLLAISALDFVREIVKTKNKKYVR